MFDNIEPTIAVITRSSIENGLAIEPSQASPHKCLPFDASTKASTVRKRLPACTIRPRIA